MTKPAQPNISRRRRGSPGPSLAVTLAAAGLCLALFAALFSQVRAGRADRLDESITRRFQRRQKPWFRKLMAAVSWPGYPPQSRLIPPLLMAIFWWRGWKVEAIFQGLAWQTSLLSFIVKSVIKRRRPHQDGIRIDSHKVDGTSFPSGHVLGYLGIYGWLGYLIHVHVRPAVLRFPLVGAIAAAVALVGPSRVYQGHHWASDVLASYLLGGSFLSVLAVAYRWIKGLR